MKIAIISLTFLLIASFFALEMTKLQAEPISIYTITFEDINGDTVEKVRFVEGADLSTFQMPIAPNIEGYVFIGWSIDLPDKMPNHSMIIEAVYMATTTIVINHQIG